MENQNESDKTKEEVTREEVGERFAAWWNRGAERAKSSAPQLIEQADQHDAA